VLATQCQKITSDPHEVSEVMVKGDWQEIQGQAEQEAAGELATGIRKVP
jgi:hypothetical protein